MKPRNSISMSLIAWCVICVAAQAEVVAVNRGAGHGFLFNDGGACYIFLPSHVHGRNLRLTYEGIGPRQTGTADVFDVEVRTMDLSIAQVSTDSPGACGTAWNEMLTWSPPDLTDLGAVTLRRVPGAGRVKNTPMTIIEADRNSFDARVAGSFDGDMIHKGTSGAIAYLGDTALGMAIQAPNPQEARFLALTSIMPALADRLALPTVLRPAWDSDIAPTGPTTRDPAADLSRPPPPIYTYDDDGDTLRPTIYHGERKSP